MLRVGLTNEFGLEVLRVGGAHIALAAEDGSTMPGTDIELRFGGQKAVAIPPGVLVFSDAVKLALPPLSDLAISLYVPAGKVSMLTRHVPAQQLSYQSAGNQLLASKLSVASSSDAWTFLKDVEVLAPTPTVSIVALGDSITDGLRSSVGANARWTDVLARRLQRQSGRPVSKDSLLNEGISGNCLILKCLGQSALARLDRGLFSHPGVRYLVVLEGVNDIRYGTTAKAGAINSSISAQQLIFALNQIIDRAHDHGIKVIGATLTPFAGTSSYSVMTEGLRQAENEFIRHSGRFDGVIDFDKVTRDPMSPLHYLPTYDSGDHLHPSDAGYKAMGESIDLGLFGQ